jgi:hypothetical protein
MKGIPVFSLASKTRSTFEQTFRSLEAVQDAGFKAVVAFAEKMPGLPRFVASAADRTNDAWQTGYFGAAQRVLDIERRAAEQLATVANAIISPRGAADEGVPLQAA